MVLVEFYAVEEDDDFGRSDERALKVNAYRGGRMGVRPEIAQVFTSEEIQITGCEGEHMIDAAVESGRFPGDEVAVGPIIGDEWDRRLDDCLLFVHM